MYPVPRFMTLGDMTGVGGLERREAAEGGRLGRDAGPLGLEDNGESPCCLPSLLG